MISIHYSLYPTNTYSDNKPLGNFSISCKPVDLIHENSCNSLSNCARFWSFGTGGLPWVDGEPHLRSNIGGLRLNSKRYSWTRVKSYKKAKRTKETSENMWLNSKSISFLKNFFKINILYNAFIIELIVTSYNQWNR